VVLFSIVEACTTFYLRWGCWTIRVGYWGKKTSGLVVLALILISSWLGVLTVLLLLPLLRKLPLVLVLVLTLMLVLVTLLELLW
jgi:hypothetical protein